MPGSLMNGVENSLLNHLFKKSTYTVPAELWLGLSSTTPAEDGTNITEPVGNGYARVKIADSGVNNMGSAASGQISNTVALEFAAATGSWGAALTHFVVYDASTGGTAQWWGALGASKTVTNGDVFRFAIGQLIFTMD